MLIVDKPVGPTSHDAVAIVRRALRTARVGHAGTLDPRASGVLVLLVGEGTKLGPWLTAHGKRYLARVAFGVATDSLDAEGPAVRVEAPPRWLEEEIAQLSGLAAAAAPRFEEALAAERGRLAQTPPAYSAIQVDGVRAYARARAGEAVELADRAVAVAALRVVGAGATSWAGQGAGVGAEDGASGHLPPRLLHVDLELEVSKGYYVRSLARDLGDRLGLPAHLASLRRTQSGPFHLDAAVPLRADPAALRGAIEPTEVAAARSLAVVQLSDEGAARARVGKRLGLVHATGRPLADAPTAWLDPAGRLVAVGTWSASLDEADGLEGVVVRGFSGGR